MKNTLKTSTRKPTIIQLSILAVVLIAVAALGFNYWHSRNKKSITAVSGQAVNKIDYSPATKADNAPNEDRKGAASPSSTLTSSNTPQNTGDFEVTINRAGLDSTKQNLQIATLINGVSTGTCTANVSQDGQATVTQTQTITLQVNHYVCPVISIPVSQFPNRDKWNVSVTVSSGGKTVTANWTSNPVSLSN